MKTFLTEATDYIGSAVLYDHVDDLSFGLQFARHHQQRGLQDLPPVFFE